MNIQKHTLKYTAILAALSLVCAVSRAVELI